MSERRAIVYCYDGSLEGLLCCVFESYAQKELPLDVVSLEEGAPLLIPVRMVETDEQRAARVLSAIPRKIGRQALELVRMGFLTCHPKKGLLILNFLRLGFQRGGDAVNMIAEETVYELQKAVRHLGNEAHLLKGFVRFSESSGALTSQIEPKNLVLPLLAPHFAARMPRENFLIHDKTHAMALIHKPGLMGIVPAEEFVMPRPGQEELRFRALWRLFYDTIEVEGRHNPRTRMGHMPKRYWRCMTEFARCDGISAEPKGNALPQGVLTNLLGGS
ncbi:MAG: TIGR03915 family putative DNA repair protein [Clostridiaceae bacterium]